MAKALSLASDVAVGMLNDTGLAEALGESPLIRLYSGTMPDNADADLSVVSNTQLAELSCAVTPFASFYDTGDEARAVFADVEPDASADAAGITAFFRIYDNTGDNCKVQGTAGTEDADMIMEDLFVTAGGPVSISAIALTLPKGP